MTASSRPVRHRVVARVLPVNSAGEVLMLHGWDPVAPETTYWFLIGGGVDPGEPHAAAAAREMLEETGIVMAPDQLGDPIGTAHVAYDWGPWHLVQEETYFAVAMEHAEVRFHGLEPMEVGTIDRAGWWTPDALDADGGAGSPEMTGMMRRAVAAVRGRP